MIRHAYPTFDVFDLQSLEAKPLQPFSSYSAATHTGREIFAIVAAGIDGAIGRDGGLLWHLPGDLPRFKELTMGHPVIMGRKTWQSLPNAPLRGRFNIIVSGSMYADEQRLTSEGKPSPLPEGVMVVPSPEEALNAVPSGDIPFVIGGATLYEAMLPLCSRIYLTLVDAKTPDADARIQINLKDWIVFEKSQKFSYPDTPPFRYYTLLRK